VVAKIPFANKNTMSTFLYNPDRKGKDELIAEFVIRTEVYDDIMEDLETSDMKHPEQHYLLVGQRGAGKTTLLHRIKYGIDDSKKLHKWLIPVLFSEEQYNVSELANLWENVGQHLEDYEGFTGLYDEMEQHISKENFEELCLDILERHLNAKKKKIVLLIDNIGDLLKKMDELEVRRLREILQTKSFIRLIAGSPFYLESILDYQQPLFEFFKVMRLDGLNKQETEKLLLTLGDVHNEKEKIERIIKETPQRIEAMRALTGGVPRTMALLFRIFIDNEHNNSIKDLEKILDAVTPLYKHKMDDLPKQQQKIVDAVARKWDAISVKELTDKVRLESKTISAQLRQLEKNQIIEKKTTDTKNHVYLLKERFWNIWFLMRYGRKDDKERVIWLVRFLESWCDNDEITQRIEAFVAKTKDGKLSKEDADLFNNVYASLSQLSLDQKLILREADTKYVTKRMELTDEELFEAAKEAARIDFKKMQIFLFEIKKLKNTHKQFLIDFFANDNESIFKEWKTLGFVDKDTAQDLAQYPSFYSVTYIMLLCRGLLTLGSNELESYKLLNPILQYATLNYTKNSHSESFIFDAELELIKLYFEISINNLLLATCKKAINATQIKYNNQTIHFKDVFKPLYYAVEYFDTPEKIQNLPSEIAGTTFEIYQSFLKKD
jgi:DNA-binding Lrp family transcriptional regulator